MRARARGGCGMTATPPGIRGAILREGACTCDTVPHQSWCFKNAALAVIEEILQVTARALRDYSDALASDTAEVTDDSLLDHIRLLGRAAGIADAAGLLAGEHALAPGLASEGER